MADDEKAVEKFTLSAATTDEEFEAASIQLGVDVDELKSTLIFVEHVAHEAERLDLPPNAAANAAVSFISGCIHSNTPEGSGDNCISSWRTRSSPRSAVGLMRWGSCRRVHNGRNPSSARPRRPIKCLSLPFPSPYGIS